MTNLEGQTFAGYEVLAKLGEGGVGSVYKARQSKPDRFVVLRVLGARLAGDAEFLKRFKHQATAAADLGHPNLVQVYCVGEHQGVHYVTSEFADGDTLDERLSRGRVDPREALAIAFYVTRALLYAWSKAQIAHLAVRPANIFLRKDGDVKLDGLGIAAPAGVTSSKLPHYLSPEQAQQKRDVDFRADIYSLGCVLYHMLAGKTPYEGDDAKTLLASHISEPPPAIVKSWPLCPASLERLLERMMAKQPEDRYRNYDDLIQELLAVREEIKRMAQSRMPSQTKAERRSFAGYTFLAKLGQDDIGTSYRARETNSKRVVIVKVLAQRFSRDAGFVDRFKRTMAAVARLKHENILETCAAGEADGTCYLVSECVDGRTLRQRMERRGQMQPREAIAVAFYAARALQHAWTTAGMTHCAITPDNVILSDSGTVKIGDFGLAKAMEAETAGADRKGLAVGSPHYMSPEQARGAKELDCRADIYGLGCLLYHMFTGRTPYRGDQPAAIMAKHNSEPPPAILKAWPGCPATLARLMDKMLSKSRSARPQNYEELLDELVKVREEFRRVKVVPPPVSEEDEADDSTSPMTTPDADEAGVESGKWNRMTLLIGAGVAALMLVAGLVVWVPWKEPVVESPPSEEHRADSFSSRVAPLEQPPPPQREPSRAAAQSGTATSAPMSSQPTQPASKPATKAGKRRKTAAVSTADTKTPDTPSTSGNTVTPRTTVGRVGGREIVMEMPTAAVPSEQPMTDETFAAAVAGLPPQEQVRRIVSRLQELNPGFDGKADSKIENNAVVEMKISTTGTLVSTVGVTDMTPLKALKHLQRLVLVPAKPEEHGALVDLSTLSGMKLTWLDCHGNPQINDLSPIKDMPLTGLICGGTLAKDLSPISAMRLTTLGINDTPVEDISVVSGMPLTTLWCQNSKVTDLSPLKGLSLRELRCDFVMVRDGPILRGISTLTMINDLPAATFWKRANLGTVTSPTAISALKTAIDFKPLFNGTDMTGWKQRTADRPNGWRVRRHSLVNTPPSDDLITKDQFGNFEFYCEIKIPRRGRSGVLLRGRYRVPLLDDMGSSPSTTSSGSVFQMIAPTKNVSKPADTWQALYVRLVGGPVTVILNGKKVIDARDLVENAGSGADEVVKSGPIALQGGGGVTFRNLRIKPLVEKGK